jgi:hypothetical protein
VHRANWEVILAYTFEHQEHINLLEAEAALSAMKVLTSQGELKNNSMVNFLVDSKAVVGAFAKGRSSSLALNRMARKMAAYILITGCQPKWIWIESKLNPADEASRNP